MRIIAGTAKGRRLHSPKSPLIRPVSDKVKEAIFNILGPIEEKSVLDLFAGTGSVGLEALSRGADRCVFVESFSHALFLLQKNIVACGFREHSFVLRGDVPTILNRLKKKGTFDLVFVDPPYDRGLIGPTLGGLVRYNLIDAQSCVIVEHSPREAPAAEGVVVFDSRKYGQTWVSFLKRTSA